MEPLHSFQLCAIFCTQTAARQDLCVLQSQQLDGGLALYFLEVIPSDVDKWEHGRDKVEPLFHLIQLRL
jgi:hypothetical protein